MTVFFRTLTFAGLCLLAACTPHSAIILYPEAAAVGQVHQVFVGTTRGVDNKGKLNNTRNEQLTYHRYDISVPPRHKIGSIEWPRFKPDPTKNFLTTAIDHFPAAADFKTELAKAIKNQPKNKREVVLYVHGFNTTFAEGMYRLAQLSADMELAYPIVHYSWPSAGSPLGYAYDRDSQLFGRDGLEHLLNTIMDSGADRVLLVAHSMGALLAVETMRQMAISEAGLLQKTISGVVLISPDIDVELFRRQAAKIGNLPQPFVIFSSKEDRALRLSARLTGKIERLGNIKDLDDISDLDVTVMDVTKFSQGSSSHFVAATSPALIEILKKINRVDAAFQNDPSGKTGIVSGAILSVKQATKVILSPVTP